MLEESMSPGVSKVSLLEFMKYMTSSIFGRGPQQCRLLATDICDVE